MIPKSETYHCHRLDLTRQAGLRLASTPPLLTPSQAFEEARKIVGKDADERGGVNVLDDGLGCIYSFSVSLLLLWQPLKRSPIDGVSVL